MVLIQGTAGAPQRPKIQVLTGTDAKHFVERDVTKAVYATAWDGTVVVEAHADGRFERVAADTTPSS